MKHIFYVTLILSLLSAFPVSGQIYLNGSHKEQIRTLKVHPINDWQGAPVLTMGTDDQIIVSWDELSHDYKRYAYRIIHCNRDWTRSDLNELEYLEGFPENDVEDYERSYSTLTLYTHYNLTIPNEHVQLKCSGNYALEVFEKDGNGEAILTARFMLNERKTGIDASVTASTDIDFEQKNQQLRVEVRPAGWSFQQPDTEINLDITQNRRSDNEIRSVKPLYLSPDKIVYEHCKELIFLAGNEYRRFETTSYKHAGLNVNKVSFFNPFYNAELLPSEPRLGGYTYDQDQDGQYLVHNTEYVSDDLCSDYFLVHFSYPMETPWIDGGLFLNGDLVDNRLNADSKLIYNFEHKAYEKTLFLKQGSYNFQYLYRPSAGGTPSLLQTEGSYWQTENKYQIYVYYRPIGGRYDQLIGFCEIKTSF
jgi:hypothetical protein